MSSQIASSCGHISNGHDLPPQHQVSPLSWRLGCSDFYTASRLHVCPNAISKSGPGLGATPKQSYHSSLVTAITTMLALCHLNLSRITVLGRFSPNSSAQVNVLQPTCHSCVRKYRSHYPRGQHSGCIHSRCLQGSPVEPRL